MAEKTIDQGQAQSHNDANHVHRPYWKRAHHDWRFWLGLFLMMLAILYYIMSDDFAIRLYLRK